MLVLVFLTTILAFADDKPAAEPDALVKARKAYEKRVKEAVDPIRADYLKTLDAMMRRFGGEGNLEAAQAVKAEIKVLSTVTVDCTAVSVLGRWSWNGGIAEFKADGRAAHSGGNFGRWKCLDKKAGRYSVEWKGRAVDSLLLSPDGSAIDARNNKGESFHAERINKDNP
jgi:hypothetical protein